MSLLTNLYHFFFKGGAHVPHKERVTIVKLKLANERENAYWIKQYSMNYCWRCRKAFGEQVWDNITGSIVKIRDDFHFGAISKNSRSLKIVYYPNRKTPVVFYR